MHWGWLHAGANLLGLLVLLAAFHRQVPLRLQLVAFIGGQTAPKGKRTGHAGAIISGGKGTAAEKMAALTAAGVRVVKSPADMGQALIDSIK